MAFHVIKEDDLFYLSNLEGNIPESGQNVFGYGLYAKDTRVLSRLEWHFEPNMLVELDADDSGNYQALYRYTNREWIEKGQLRFPRECLFVKRHQVVDGSRFYEAWSVHNYGRVTLTFDVECVLEADFRDMFEVRGFSREQKAGTVETQSGPGSVQFVHTAIDGVRSVTNARLVKIDVGMTARGDANESGLRLHIQVAPGQETGWLLTVETIVGAQVKQISAKQTDASTSQANSQMAFERARQTLSSSYHSWLSRAPRVQGDVAFERWYTRGLNDIRMLLTDIGYGQFPVAGVPWYAVPFGRDSLITSMQLLLVNPDVTKGTLKTMAAYQGTKVDPTKDEQPGKIMHELRAGELTRTGQVPFGPYYGTIDATPLFLTLAADYYAWTGDQSFIRSLLPHVERAFEWIQKYGDRDGDGFVEYYQEASKGLANQGWKDSGDSTVHKDGSLASAPIALCEVQGYVYRAYTSWFAIYQVLGQTERASALQAKSDALRQNFIEKFWMDEQSGVALALDGRKQQVASLSSNMGQVLWSGILPPELAERMIDRILADDLFNGFGIRTLSKSEVAYNPLSYHNGSIWPHDNSIIISGMHLYGRKDAVASTVGGLLRSAKTFPHMRLPELFTGFGPDEVEFPVPYPVSCSPQAWAAATPVLCLQSLLGMEPQIATRSLQMNPVLPDGVDQLVIDGIRFGSGELDIGMHKTASGETTIEVKRNTTGLEVQQGAPTRP